MYWSCVAIWMSRLTYMTHFGDLLIRIWLLTWAGFLVFSFLASISWILISLAVCSACALCFSQAKPSRLHCSHCDETYSLPQNGAIKLYKELRCPLDEFELVLWTSGSRGKSYPLCPYCFSNPPFRDMKKGNGELQIQNIYTTSFLKHDTDSGKYF